MFTWCGALPTTKISPVRLLNFLCLKVSFGLLRWWILHDCEVLIKHVVWMLLPVLWEKWYNCCWSIGLGRNLFVCLLDFCLVKWAIIGDYVCPFFARLRRKFQITIEYRLNYFTSFFCQFLSIEYFLREADLFHYIQPNFIHDLSCTLLLQSRIRIISFVAIFVAYFIFYFHLGLINFRFCNQLLWPENGS